MRNWRRLTALCVMRVSRLIQESAGVVGYGATLHRGRGVQRAGEVVPAMAAKKGDGTHVHGSPMRDAQVGCPHQRAPLCCTVCGQTVVQAFPLRVKAVGTPLVPAVDEPLKPKFTEAPGAMVTL